LYNKVAVVRANKDKLAKCLEKTITMVGGFRPRDRAQIVIKPNLCAPKSPETGVTTDVRVVEALLDYINRKNGNFEISIVESNTDEKPDKTFRLLGYEELAEKYDNVHLCNLSKEPTVKVYVPQAKVLKWLKVPISLFSMDYFISVAKMKRHIFERYSGAWKNQYGLIPNRPLRIKLHPFISELLFDLNNIFYPDLSIIDGITGLEGRGPIKGKPKRMNLIVCSKNPLSADIITAKIMGENPRKIPHIKYALTHGFKNAENLILIDETDAFSANNKFEYINNRDYLRLRRNLFLKKFRLFWVPFIKRLP
jgi:uncharacterized protein (DUF362 family)